VRVNRIVWNWYRNGKFISRSNYCHMRFTDTPFTLRTWRAARTIGPGQIRVDTIIDGTTQFDITTVPSPNQQGSLPAQQSCG
jgi:hypothetical protein